jgi:hypothetical protein
VRRGGPLASLPAWAALAALACASGGVGPPPSLARLWREFRELPAERALAIAGDPEKLWVAGVSGSHASRAQAEEAAIAECRRRRFLQRMQAPCRLYAVGDEIPWDP